MLKDIGVTHADEETRCDKQMLFLLVKCCWWFPSKRCDPTYTGDEHLPFV